jgi:HEAT repeat protein
MSTLLVGTWLLVHSIIFVWSLARIIPLTLLGDALLSTIIVMMLILARNSLEETPETSAPRRRVVTALVRVLPILLAIALLVTEPLLGIRVLLLVIALEVLFNGGIAVIERLSMLLILRQKRLLPWNHRQFLRLMTERHLLRTLGGGHTFVHSYVLENFAKLDEVRILIDELDEPDEVPSAKQALVRIGKRAIPVLVGSLPNSSNEVRAHLLDILNQLAWQPANPQEQTYHLISRHDWTQCSVLGHPAVTPLIQALDDTDSQVRSGVVRALGQIGHDKAFIHLLRALRDNSATVRESAAEALGKLGNDHAINALIEALSDASPAVRHAAMRGLVQIGAPAVEPLVKLVATPSTPEARCGAVWTLGEIGDVRAVTPLVNALGIWVEDIRHDAIEALVKIGQPAIAPIDTLLHSKSLSGNARSSALEVLKRIGTSEALSLVQQNP